MFVWDCSMQIPGQAHRIHARFLQVGPGLPSLTHCPPQVSCLCRATALIHHWHLVHCAGVLPAYMLSNCIDGNLIMYCLPYRSFTRDDAWGDATSSDVGFGE